VIGIQECVNKKREQSHVTIREFKIIEELTDISSQIIIFRGQEFYEKKTNAFSQTETINKLYFLKLKVCGLYFKHIKYVTTLNDASRSYTSNCYITLVTLL